MKTPNKRQAGKQRKLGGRATATGVGYEAKIAASLAVKMLGGDRCVVTDENSGEEIIAITMQDAEPVDDIVVTLRGLPEAKIFISAKHRAQAIPMTGKSPAFQDVIVSFVRQFLKLTPPLYKKSRLMWAVPSSAGVGVTQDLQKALDTFKSDAFGSLTDFLRRRDVRQRRAADALIAQAKHAWKSVTTKLPTESELQEFLRMVCVAVFDFGTGLRHEQTSEDTIRTLIAENSGESRRIWEKLELHFNRADQRGLRTTPASLRQMLDAEGLKLKTAPTFAADIDLLRRLTARNLDRLKDHTKLRFIKSEIHIERTAEISAMVAAAKHGHLLVTGEPGCGKSGMLYSLLETLDREGVPVVLLLAEEVFDRDWKGAANIPGLSHAIDDVLANWPNGAKGMLITDALDAVRDVEIQRTLRRLLEDAQRGTCGWTAIASVREFDLKHGRELREAFPGDGVVGHCSTEFTGVSHFHLTGLTETELDELVVSVAEIGPFIASARANPRSNGIHRSPFFLRLAGALLRDGISPSRLADWSNPAVLLRKFWKTRVADASGANHRKVALRAICNRMTQVRSMVISTQEISLSASELDAVDELRSRGIFQAPIIRYGDAAGEDELRFSHHLLHDYAIARSLIPCTSSRFVAFAIAAPLLPIFYRQSFLFALEELWDGPDGRNGFWDSALRMEAVAQLHGVTRILGPILGARRVDSPSDLAPLLAAIRAGTDDDSPAERALRHMSSGLQDADSDSIRAGSGAWCSFAADLSQLLFSRPSLETPIVHILARLNAVSGTFEKTELHDLNIAAQWVLLHHLSKDVSKGWRYAGVTAIETLCRTFTVATAESERVLLSVLAPARLAQFPHWDLFDFAQQIKHLDASGDSVVLSLFEAAFSTEPKMGEWENFGGLILPMRMQSSDNWNSIHYSLAEYYERSSGTNAAMMTEIACTAWNATVRRRVSGGSVVAKIYFRGVECELVEDYGHVWERYPEHEENQIISRFEKLLSHWASSGDTDRLNLALDHFAKRNRTSVMWTIFMEVGASYPAPFGWMLAPALSESIFLTHFDYSYGATLLFAALHKTGDDAQRCRLEKLILDLPKTARFLRDEPREPTPSWLQDSQDRLLAVLEEANVVLPEIRTLRKERTRSGPLPSNRKPEGFQITSHTFSEQEQLERRGISLNDPVNSELFRLKEALKPFREQKGSEIEVLEIDRCWSLIGQCERAIHRHRRKHRELTTELWGHLVGACENLACHVNWPANSNRWKTIRRILLKASTDPSPRIFDDEDAKKDRWPSWGWPAPRLDSARGLPLLVLRTGRIDKALTTALFKLADDKSHALRFNLADRLAPLHEAAPKLMWQLIDHFVQRESKFSILEMIVNSLDRLWKRYPDEVKPRLAQIAELARQSADDENHIHETLAHIYLFRFLRTGDADCGVFIDTLVSECHRERAARALQAQLHGCRAGGWLTAGDAVRFVEPDETLRRRTWSFLANLLSAAQAKLQNGRERAQQLFAAGQAEAEEAKKAQETIDCTGRLVDSIAMQLYFASGAFADKQKRQEDHLSEAQMRRFWNESANLFGALSKELHPHTAHHLVGALHHLLPCAPREVFLTATRTINSSSRAGYQHESLAVGDVVKLIQRALADHREIFQGCDDKESACLVELLKVLDIFVEAGWPEARQLTHRLEEIYR